MTISDSPRILSMNTVCTAKTRNIANHTSMDSNSIRITTTLLSIFSQNAECSCASHFVVAYLRYSRLQRHFPTLVVVYLC